MPLRELAPGERPRAERISYSSYESAYWMLAHFGELGTDPGFVGISRLWKFCETFVELCYYSGIPAMISKKKHHKSLIQLR